MKWKAHPHFGLLGFMACVAGCIIPFSGNNPVYQDVEVLVTEVESGLSVVGATVTLARADDASGFDDPDDFLDEYLSESSVTGDDGRAGPTARNLAGCFGSIFLLSFFESNCEEAFAEDRVTGQSYLIRVSRDASSEIVEMNMTVNASAAGEFFSATIEQIGSPYRFREMDP